MGDPLFKVLFLCNGNSARSIMAEAILNKVGVGKFQAHSAGSQPEGYVHPETIGLLQSLGYVTRRFRSKSWIEFGRPGAPALDFVFTVCDTGGGETCPVWLGRAMTAPFGRSQSGSGPGEIARRSCWHSRMPTACCITGQVYSYPCLSAVSTVSAFNAVLRRSARRTAKTRSHRPETAYLAMANGRA